MEKSHFCNHDVDSKYLNNCLSCFKSVEERHSECDHQKTVEETEMTPSAYSIVIIDNYTDKLIIEDSYVLTRDEDEPVVQHFLKNLRNKILPKLSPHMKPEVCWKLTLTSTNK